MALVDDLRAQVRPISTPHQILETFPLSERGAHMVADWRQTFVDILCGKDELNRLIVVAGPCSIHDVDAAMEYYAWLAKQAQDVEEDVFVVARAYFEKPRTSVGWKGLINDPHLDDTCDIETGFREARKLLRFLVEELSLPAGTELLDPLTPQYIADLLTMAAIGARTAEAQLYRCLAAALSMAVGFKNIRHGIPRSATQVAVDAILAAREEHTFLSVTKHGQSAIVRAAGNPNGFCILRGVDGEASYSQNHVRTAAEMLPTNRQTPAPIGVLVDCSHGNSSKNYRKQPQVAKELLRQVAGGSRAVRGLMLESFLNEGKQSFTPGVDDPSKLAYGVSITDGCISRGTTKRLVRKAAAASSARKKLRSH
ncbi:3-deoxy-7-phosphoheptulonate synthase [Candidatus Uhrbacteria bacterium CG10_big_fil_rev_8_21_14_0_10_48_11]|uniref:Phospho-2-dehydro-3-deoxyheptonate aldolase n=1 Tax=Candidatus Uhrbacteria bacterium CG10_big_fil_rev_8_21_14_0_10_48_11 TaxID=1975037 RepID=A0A2M8LFA2_9BACT|nr:MAG: 3-deoxy-7-phosphoheptulonate synthase [Candidatus Uhrbacteria bacterium CG10_big_fil_rev_8_21_14_0_10_48_11]